MKISYSVSTDVTVKNENGTSRFHDDNCGSWLQHWKNYGGNERMAICLGHAIKSIVACAISTCIYINIIGA